MLYDLFIYTVPLLAVLTAIVFFHEMGHFLMGRVFGVKIDAFSIGFGPELLHYVDRKGTRWRLALLPLGGYVKFHGDANGASMPDAEAVAAMPEHEREKTLFGQPVWKRAAVVAAGPFVNFVLAIAIFASLYTIVGRDFTKPIVNGVMEHSAAAEDGFKPNDVVTAMNGRPVDSFEEMQRIILNNDGSPIVFTVDRDGKPMTLTATPRRRTIPTPFGNLSTNVLGVQVLKTKDTVRLVKSNPIEAIGQGAAETWYVVANTGHYLKGLLAGRESADQLSGPIRIAKVSATVARNGLEPVLQLAAYMSISIGLLNLLPVPLLDGGFLMFFAIEAIRGRALNEKTMEVGFRIGLTLVAALTIFVAYNDTTQLLSSKSTATPPAATASGPIKK